MGEKSEYENPDSPTLLKTKNILSKKNIETITNKLKILISKNILSKKNIETITNKLEILISIATTISMGIKVMEMNTHV